jgi:hypothetical protein
VGVIRFLFHVLHLLLIKATSSKLCCINKYGETANKTQSEDQISHGLVMVIGSACLLILG